MVPPTIRWSQIAVAIAETTHPRTDAYIDKGGRKPYRIGFNFILKQAAI
jgi:hypothetical protein